MVKEENNPKAASVSKFDIYKDFYHLPCRTGKTGHHVKVYFSSPQRVKIVTLSRSLACLYDRNLIYKPASFYVVVLTNVGIMRARELLLSKKEDS